MSRAVNPPRSSMCAVQWAQCLCCGVAALASAWPEGLWELAYQWPCCSSVNTFLPAPLHQGLLTAAGPLGLERMRFGTTHFEFKMESPFSGIRLLHWKRILLVLFNVLTSFFPDVNFLKQIGKLPKSWSSARILPQHFILLPELYMAKCASECRRLNK